MNRRGFLNAALGAGVIAHTLDGCTKKTVTPTPPPASGLTIDLSSPSNAVLKTTGGFILTKGVYIICTGSSTYVALSAVCTHQGCTVNYDSGNKKFSCPCHGGMYDGSGKVLVGPPTSPLQEYSVTVTGNILTIS